MTVVMIPSLLLKILRSSQPIKRNSKKVKKQNVLTSKSRNKIKRDIFLLLFSKFKDRLGMKKENSFCDVFQKPKGHDNMQILNRKLRTNRCCHDLVVAPKIPRSPQPEAKN